MNFFDPKTGQLLRPPYRGPGPLAPAPIGRRRRGFGDIPNASGVTGSLIPEYQENDIFNPAGIVGGGTPAGNIASTAPTSNPSATGYMPASSPFGESDRAWSNPTTFASVPINAATNTNVPVLAQNYQRNALILQNGSLATVAGDVAPTLYVNFNAQPQVGSSLALPPGVGVVFDIICPRDAVYIAFGPFVNTGGSVVIQGVVLTGTYAP